MNKRIEPCWWCGRRRNPEDDACSGCGMRGRKFEPSEVMYDICGCPRLPLLLAADALTNAAEALERAAYEAQGIDR